MHSFLLIRRSLRPLPQICLLPVLDAGTLREHPPTLLYPTYRHPPHQDSPRRRRPRLPLPLHSHHFSHRSLLHQPLCPQRVRGRRGSPGRSTPRAVGKVSHLLRYLRSNGRRPIAVQQVVRLRLFEVSGSRKVALRMPGVWAALAGCEALPHPTPSPDPQPTRSDFGPHRAALQGRFHRNKRFSLRFSHSRYAYTST